MKLHKVIFLGVLLAGLNTGFAQSKSYNTRGFFNARNLFPNSIFQKKAAIGSTETKTILPLIAKKKNETDQDLFTQLINWDCKIKVKLNDHFNFILTYN